LSESPSGTTGRSPLCFDLDQGHVCLRVTPDNLGVELFLIREGHFDIGGVFDDVVVGDDVAIFVDDEPRTQAVPAELALRTAAAEEALKKLLKRAALAALAKWARRR
jgi:hypothetical protein